MGKLSPKILGATAVGLALVGGAFWLAPQETKVTNAASENEASGQIEASLRTFIPVGDQDQNSVPDWQESFATADINLDELEDYEPQGETGRLATELGQSLITSLQSGAPFSMPATSLREAMLDEQFDRTDILIASDNSQNALRAYGNRVAEIAFNNPIPAGTENELIILRTALTASSEEALSELDPIIASYEGMLEDLLQTPVPDSLVREHLSLLNVYQALRVNLTAFRGVFDDALLSMIRFRRYPSDAEALQLALSNLYLRLNDAGIKWQDSEPAGQLIEIRPE